MKKKIILIGMGGHASACIDVLENNNYELFGFIDNKIKKDDFHNLKYLGKDKDLENIIKLNPNLFCIISFGNHKLIKKRTQIFKKIREYGYSFEAVISKASYIAKKSFINDGTIIMNHVVINIGVSIGKNCIINTGSIVDHNSTIDDNCIISTNVTINGDVHIGEGTFIGSGAIISNDITIGSGSVIGAGVVIKKSLPNNSILK